MNEQILTDTLLPASFYRTDGITLARSLLGKVLVRRTSKGLLCGVISETEAYMGITDKASHAYGGRRTPRTETMYLEGGHAYVYLIYGIYSCMNITANAEGNPEAVLIRGIVPLYGFDGMMDAYTEFTKRRTGKPPAHPERYGKAPLKLTDGPGKLCAAMEIDRSLNGMRVYDGGEIFVSDVGIVPAGGIGEHPRIGIDYAEEAALFPWRFTVNRPNEIATTV